MFSEELELLIEAAMINGTIGEKQFQILSRRAVAEGIDPDEFEMIINSRLIQKQKMMMTAAAPPLPTQPVQEPMPTNQKVGGINKCPSCGAVVETGNISCVKCGHTFVNMEGNNSVQRFANMIREIESRHQTGGESTAAIVNGLTNSLGLGSRKNEICSAIDTFPIPNSKEDLLEFLCFLKPKAEKTNQENKFSKGMLNVVTYGAYGALSKDKITMAYKAKYEECLQKAMMFLNNDPQFEELLILNNIIQPKKKKFFVL